MLEVLPPLQWAQRHFGEAELGDQRRTKRTVAYAASAAAGPSLSVPRQCGGEWRQTKGAYRLFDQPQVSLDRVQEPHRRLTLAEASSRPVVLWVSDTTTLSFDHPATEGLGATSSGGRGRGMLLHSTLAVDVSGGIDASPLVLGLGHQQAWARSIRGNQPRPESIKWPAGVEALGDVPAGVRWVHVADAESDCWEAIDACRRRGVGFAVRACQDRQVLAGHALSDEGSPEGAASPATLFELLRQQPAMGNKKLWTRSRPDRAAGWAALAVSALAVTLLAPRNWSDKPHRKGKPRPEPIRCWALRICQINTPSGQKPVEWIILTDEPLDELAAALRVSFWYSCRWLIEEYHKCLKSGCRVEDRQLEKAHRLQSLVGILAVVAVRLLQLKHQAKLNPTALAIGIVPNNYVQTLAAYLKQPSEKMTARQFWIETARLGGFLGRKSDGDPGWLTLWQGWQHLETLTTGFELAKGFKWKCG
jgi:hypothetical protein